MRRFSTLLIAATLLGTATTTWSQDIRTRNLLISGGNNPPNTGLMNTVFPLTQPRTYTLPDANGFLLVSPVALAPNTGLVSNNLGQVANVVQTDGEILIGSTGNAPAAGSLIGIRGIGVTYNVGDLEISLPTGATDNSFRFDGADWVAETDFLIAADGSITGNANATLGNDATDNISVTGATTINGGTSTATTSIGNALGGTITLDPGIGDLTLLNIPAATSPETAQLLLLEGNNARTANIGDVAWLVGGNSLGGGGNQLIGNLDDDRFEIITNGATRIYVGNDAFDNGNVGIGNTPSATSQLFVDTPTDVAITANTNGITPGSIGLVVTSGYEGITIDAADAGLIIGNNTTPVSGIEVEASATGIIVGQTSNPSVGVSSSANNLTGTAFLASNAAISFAGDGASLLGDGTGADDVDIQLGTGILSVQGLTADNTTPLILTQDITGQVFANTASDFAWLVGGNTFAGNSTYILGTLSTDNVMIQTDGSDALEIDGTTQDITVSANLTVNNNATVNSSLIAGDNDADVHTILGATTINGGTSTATTTIGNSAAGAISATTDSDITLTVGTDAGDDLILENITVANPITDILWITAQNEVRRSSFTGTANEGVEFDNGAYRLGAAIDVNPIVSGRIVTVGAGGELSFRTAGATSNMLQLNDNGNVTINSDGTGTTDIGGATTGSISLSTGAAGSDLTINIVDGIEVDGDRLDADFINGVSIEAGANLELIGATGVTSTASSGTNTLAATNGNVLINANPGSGGNVIINTNAAADLFIAEASITRAGTIALNPGTGNNITTDGGITSAENVTITSGGLTVTAGGATITAGGLSVDAGDAAFDDNVTLGATSADAVTINAATVTAANLPAGADGDNLVTIDAGGAIRETSVATALATSTWLVGGNTFTTAGARSIGTNSAHDLEIESGGVTRLAFPNASATVSVTADVLPSTGNTFDVGSDASRWDGMYVSGATGQLHIGPANGQAGSTEMVLGYGGTRGTLNVDGGAAEIAIQAGNIEANATIVVDNAVGANSTISETGISRAGNIAINPGTGNDITTNGGITSAENVTITSGGLTVSAGGAAITGNSTVTGTLTSTSTLTVNTGGLQVTAGGINLDAGNAVFDDNVTLGATSADAVTINAATVTAANLPAYTAGNDILVRNAANQVEVRTVTLNTGSGTTNRLTRWTGTNALGDASLTDDGAGAVQFVSGAGTLDMNNAEILNIGAAGTDFSATGGLTLADNLTVTAGGLTVTAGGATVTAGGLTVSAGGAAITGNSTVTGTLTSTSTLTVNTGGLQVTAGGINLDAGNATFDDNVTLGATAADAVISNGVFRTENAVNVKVDVVNSTATLDNTNNVVLANATTAAFTVTLPPAVNGRTYTIKKIDPSLNAVTIAAAGAETIDGAATINLLNQNDFITIVALSGDWYIIGTN